MMRNKIEKKIKKRIEHKKRAIKRMGTKLNRWNKIPRDEFKKKLQKIKQITIKKWELRLIEIQFGGSIFEGLTWISRLGERK